MDFFIPILNTLVIAFLGILLMIGLMSAPWQVLLFILVLGILAYQWLVQRHHLQSVLQDINSGVEADGNATRSVEISDAASQSEDTAQTAESALSQVLHYRGATYTPSAESTSDPAAEHHPTVEIRGQYRGGQRKFFL